MKRIGIDARLWRRETGGVGRYSRNLVAELVKLDQENEYTIIITPADEPEFSVKAPNLRTLVAHAPHHSLAEQRRLPRLLKRERFDLVHFTYFSHPILYRQPFVVTVHDLIMHFCPSGAQTRSVTRKLAYRWVMNGVRRAKKIIAPSQATKSDLVRVLHYAEDKIAVTPEGSEGAFRPHSQEEIRAVKERFGLPDRYILFVSRWERYKGLTALFEAFELVSKRCPDAALVVCGKPTSHDSEMAALVSSKQKEGQRIVTPGFVGDGDLAALYSAAAAYVLPSWYEGFGLMVLEAFASGVPVVTSNVSSLPEVVGEAGLLVDPQDPREIADKIALILSDRNLADDLRRRGLERVRQFSWRRTAEQTLDIYKEALSKPVSAAISSGEGRRSGLVTLRSNKTVLPYTGQTGPYGVTRRWHRFPNAPAAIIADEVNRPCVVLRRSEGKTVLQIPTVTDEEA